MGLEFVEFIMGVEEAFRIEIPDDVASSLGTPRLVIDYIVSQLPMGIDYRCLSQHAFYRVRNAIRLYSPIPRSSLRPSTELLAVLPSGSARETWAEIGRSLRYKSWPKLRGQSWWDRAFPNSRPLTLGDAARDIVAFNPTGLKPDGQPWSRQEITSVVRGLIRYHFDIKIFSLDDRFGREINVD